MRILQQYERVHQPFYFGFSSSSLSSFSGVRTLASATKRMIPPIGYIPWKPGDPRRHMWPLYGLSSLPNLPTEYITIAKQFFGRGSTFLGNHTTLLMDPEENEKEQVKRTFEKKSLKTNSSKGNTTKGKSSNESTDSIDDSLSSSSSSEGRGKLSPIALQNAWNTTKSSSSVPSSPNSNIRKPSVITGSSTNHLYTVPPVPSWVEVAVIGRSNVGKSSLLNTLFGGSYNTNFVPTSNKPGTTAALDFYSCGTIPPNSELVLVDTPGYGYSQQGLSSHSLWMQTISSYLYVRKSTLKLRRLIVLIDSRTGLTTLDKDVISMLHQANIPIQIVLTKIDALTDAELEQCVYLTATYVSTVFSTSSLFPILHGISSKNKEGILDLQYSLVQAAKLANGTLSGQRIRNESSKT